MSDHYELERADALPERFKRHVPQLEARKTLQVGSFARLCVIVNGADYIAPWVTVVEVKKDGSYVGKVGGISNSPDWHEYGTLVQFSADNVVEL